MNSQAIKDQEIINFFKFWNLSGSGTKKKKKEYNIKKIAGIFFCKREFNNAGRRRKFTAEMF